MGFRFRKSIRIAPGVRLNLGKTGMSMSVGRRGLTTTVSARGTRTTVGLPGTGLSYSTFTPAAPRSPASSGVPSAATGAATGAARAGAATSWWPVVVLLMVLGLATVPAATVLMVTVGGIARWALRHYRHRATAGPSTLASEWARVRHTPQDPQYAVLLAQWYAPGITDADRRTHGVP